MVEVVKVLGQEDTEGDLVEVELFPGIETKNGDLWVGEWEVLVEIDRTSALTQTLT